MSDNPAAPARAMPDPPIPRRPRLGFGDILLLLWRAKWLMLLVFLPIFGLGLLLALQMPKTFTASSRLIATLDDFYVYRPAAGGEAAGVTLEQDQVIQAELEIMRSPVVFERVLAQRPIEQVYPKIAEARDEAIASGEVPRALAMLEAESTAIDAMADDFGAGAAPQTPIIYTSYTHRDPQLAADVLNTVIETYIDYRAELLTGADGDGFGNQRAAFEGDLAKIEAEMAEFRDTYSFTEFDAERAAVQRLAESVDSDLLTIRAQIRAVDGELATVNRNLDQTARNVDIFVEDSTAQRLIDLRLEREDLLSRYTESSAPVRAIDARIAQVEGFLGRQGGPQGTVRRGPNPVHQSLATTQASLQGQARSLADQAAELQRQRDALQARQTLLASIAPDWRALQRTRNLAEAGVIDYARRESEALARSQLAAQNTDNITVLEPARVPVEGSSMRRVVAAAAFLFGGFSALMAGLVYVFTRRGFATPASLARTTGVPVLATLGKMPRGDRAR